MNGCYSTDCVTDPSGAAQRVLIVFVVLGLACVTLMYNGLKWRTMLARPTRTGVVAVAFGIATATLVGVIACFITYGHGCPQAWLAATIRQGAQPSSPLEPDELACHDAARHGLQSAAWIALILGLVTCGSFLVAARQLRRRLSTDTATYRG